MSGIITQLCTTIQGEGPSAGQSCLLIRLGNCNLNCSFCDTKWTNRLKLNEIPSIKSTTDSLPVKIETNEEMDTFIDMCKVHISNYIIKRALITGGEPFLNEKFLKELLTTLYRKLNITTVEIETNGTLLNNNFFNKDLQPAFNIQLNISPKLNPEYYMNQNINSFADLITLFKTRYLMLNILLNAYPFFLSANYKFVYSKDIENDLNDFIYTINPQIPIHIMPLTPDYLNYTDEFTFLQDYRKSCYDAIDYCLRNNYIFSPRMHIWVFNNFEHRNEFEDCKNKEALK